MAAKTILITGSTDGIGKLTAKALATRGHRVLLHGRSPAKLEAVAAEIDAVTELYAADLSRLSEVEAMATQILARHQQLDVLINNAGVLNARQPRTQAGLDLRFVVNTLAPYLLTLRLLPIIPRAGRVVNLSSAAQAPVDLGAMTGQRSIDDMGAYAQSKLAITIWSQELAKRTPEGPVIVAVNPGSLLGSKMVKQGFGVEGKDLQIGVDILSRAALDPEFGDASGKYFDNDVGRFGPPHAAALDPAHAQAVMRSLDELAASAPGPAERGQ